MIIGEIIKWCRTNKKFTQEEMAAALHITPQAISRWETGLSYPDITMLPLISKYLNVSTDVLLGCANPQDIKPQKVPNQSQIDSIFDYVPGEKETGKNVLVVDDAPFMRMMLKEILSSDGHNIIQATNGEECLTILETTPIDTCILDINMPVMDGMQALEIIKQKYPQIKVIMLSAQCTEDTVQKALLFGADGFVAKPFAPNTILERMY